MSKIDGSARNSQDDVARRNREDYQKKESELIKKHSKEIRKINELHMQDVEKMRKNNSDVVQNIQKTVVKSVTERDAKYRKQIDDIRKMHHKQVGELKAEGDKRVKLERESSQISAKMGAESSKERIRNLKNHYEGALKATNANYREKLTEVREKQGSAISKQRDQFQKKYKTELTQLSDSSRREKADLQYKFAEHREQSKAAAQRQQLNSMSTQRRTSENSMEQLQRERSVNDDQMTALRIGFQDSLKSTRERFQLATDQKNRDVENGRLSFKKDIDQRIDGQVRSLEQKVESLKTANNLERTRLKQAAQREKSNLMNSFQKNIDSYENSRVEGHKVGQQQHAEDLNQLQEKNDKITNQITNFYKRKVNEGNSIHRTSYNSLENNLNARLQQNTTSSQSRVDNILADTSDSVSRLKKNYDVALNTIKKDYEREKTDLVVKMTAEKENSVERLKDVIAKKEIARTEKETSLVRKYEKQIKSLNDKNIKDKNFAGTRERILLKQLANANKQALESQKIQYTEKLDRLKSDQRLEIGRMQEKHRTQMDAVLAAVSKG